MRRILSEQLLLAMIIIILRMVFFFNPEPVTILATLNCFYQEEMSTLNFHLILQLSKELFILTTVKFGLENLFFSFDLINSVKGDRSMPGEAVFMAPEECGMNSDDQDGIDFIELHNMHEANIIPFSLLSTVFHPFVPQQSI